MKRKVIIIFAVVLLVGLCCFLLFYRQHKSVKGVQNENQRKEVVEQRKVKQEVKVIEEQLKVEIHRYDQDIFKIDLNDVQRSLKSLSERYPSIFIAPDAWKDSLRIQQITAFLTDPAIVKLHEDVEKKYPDLSFLQKEMERAFTYYKFYFPTAEVPRLYTVVSGVDVRSVPILRVDEQNLLIIGLDWFLGADNKYYDYMGLPKYRRVACDKSFIAMSCFSQAIAYRHLPKQTPITLLDNMIEAGKMIYFTEMMFPDAQPNDVISYTSDQFSWAEQHQADVWNYLIENDLLFSKDDDVVRRLVYDAPFSNPFRGSPGRMGAFIGWKILINYMEKNPDVTLNSLMLETDSQKILDKSGYKPLK